MDKTENQDKRDDPTGAAAPWESSGPMRQWLDNFLTPGEAGAEPPADPIARNPKDEGQPGAAVHAAEVRRRREVSGLPLGAALGSDPAGGLYQRPQAGPATSDLIASILRFKGTILIVWILVAAPILAAIWTQITPKYEARAEIRVRPTIPRLVFRTEENGPLSAYDSFVNTQVSTIRGPTVANVIADRDLNGVGQTQWFTHPRKTIAERLRGRVSPPEERLRDNLTVRARPRTEIIDISFRAASPNDARTILAAVVDRYLRDVKQATSDDKLAISKQLETELKALQGEIAGLEATRTLYVTNLKTDDPRELIARERVRLDEKLAQLSDVRRRIALLDKLANTDSNDASVAAVDKKEKQPEYYEDEQWRRLDLEAKRIRHQIANSIQGPNHPGRIRAENDLKFAEGLVRDREAQLDKQWRESRENAAARSAVSALANGSGPAGAALSVKDQLTQAREDEKLLKGQVEQLQGQFDKDFADAQKLETAHNELRQKRELFDAVRQRKEQMDIEEKNLIGKIELWWMPTNPPSRPANDRRIVFTVMALMAGLGLGGGVGLLRASRNQTIYVPQDMPQPARVPLLGYMPLIHLDKPVGEALSKEIERKQGVLIESVRVLRTALLARLNGHGRTTVVVTSANRGTGKSSVTLVLGKSLAQAGRKVLMIDADARRMGLSKRLNMTNRPGFRESLKDGTAENLHVFATGTAGLDMMPAGLRGKDNSVFDEIAHDAFKSWLGQLFERHGYQIVLLDAPPLLPVADAAILAGQADGTILVEREHVSRRAEVASALLLLGSAGGHLLGTVFVGSAPDDRYGYGHGYGYYGGRSRES